MPSPPLSITEAWCRWHKKRETPFFTSLQPDGAIGSHAAAANAAREDFKELAEKIMARITLE